jgi:phosphoribosylglycinamide formyltransferase-1
VLISGRGSNLEALISACAAPDDAAEIVLAVADRPDAVGLRHAERAGITSHVVDRERYATKAGFEAALQETLDEAGADLICLAGFMRLLSPRFVGAWRDRLLNIHPSLLPALPGLRTHERALAANMETHGATVHFVRAETDSGPIVVQAAVAILPDDTPDSLAARVLTMEHRIYPMALELVASGKARVIGEKVVVPEEVRRMHSDLIWPI